MTTFTIDPISNITYAEFRATWRETLRAGIHAWRNAGEPRDAVTVDTLNLITETLDRMRAVCWGSELARIEELTADMERVTAQLADADAQHTAPADLPAPDASPDIHAECTERAEQLRVRLREAQASITDASDYRLEELWSRVHEVADNRGYCSTFDEIADELGIPARMISVTAVISATVCVEVSASELADDWRNAIAEAMDTYDLDWEVSSYEKD